MAQMPRLAFLASPEDQDPSIAGLAFLGALSAAGWKVQHFRSWACPQSSRPIGSITGFPGRHLDAWLMPPAVCRSVFLRGARQADLAIIEGTHRFSQIVADPPGTSDCSDRSTGKSPGSIGPLVEMLDLPTVIVLDCRSGEPAGLPLSTGQACAVVLDGIQEIQNFQRLRVSFQEATGLPVIGGLELLPAVRAGLAAWPAGRPIPRELLEPLVQSFLKTADWPLVSRLARSRPFPTPEQEGFEIPAWMLTSGERRFRVAYAQDEAFGGYFPDTLEAFELLGAELVEFSPLRSESLPRSVDLVMIGCGFPDQHAARLSANFSLISELQAGACRGLRIYAEGGGAVYLGRSMRIGDQVYPGAGILPIDSVLGDENGWPRPVERQLIQESWLARSGTVVRGYRSGRWKLQPAPNPTDCPTRSGRLSAESDIVFRSQAIGSLVHLHLSALANVVSGFASQRKSNVGRLDSVVN